ncbi:uncharacterized protein LOC111867992 [Cryptotermes secundus]|uniref:uncharacterized protein LOC111867992 n=1 Tax=Cryptotermes secundus TaxID=105785 RepID=UPI000CD7BD4C|nr:uncharacterized protein LOC111867992 [Cryptotermes secundus]
MAQRGLEALQAQVEALRAELETLKVAEEQRDYVRGSDSPQGRRRSRGLPKQKKAGRCFRCRKIGHYARDCRQDPDLDFSGWWFGEDHRRPRGTGSSRESRPAPGARSRECPKGLGPGAGVKPRVPSGSDLPNTADVEEDESRNSSANESAESPVSPTPQSKKVKKVDNLHM